MVSGQTPRTITDLHQGANACLPYGGDEDPVRLVLPYILDGLESGERCVYVVGDHDPRHVERSLAEAGVDVSHDVRRGALVIVTQWDATFPGGSFDPVAMIQYVRSAIDDALASGFCGLRIIAEMSWALRMGVRPAQLLQFEALGASLYPDEPLTAICMYNRDRFPAEVCHDALRSHPLVVRGDQVYPNLYYELPDRLVGEAGLAEQVDWMLDRLAVLRDAEDERTALAEAEARVQARDEFVSIAVHELRSPLTSIAGFAHLAERRVRRLCEPDQALLSNIVSSLVGEIGRLGGLAGRLLDVTQIDSDRLSIDPEPLDLRDVVQQAVRRANRTLKHPVVSSLPDTPVEVLADHVRMQQVLGNLLDNAGKYSPADEVIHVELRVEDQSARLSVRDHGEGIPESVRSRIFERSFQADREHGGLGLGLYICREIIQRHGGAIWAESPEDGGALFVVALPLPAVE